MKNTDHKSLIKSARKAAAVDIEASLVAALKNAADKLGQRSESFAKKIEKGAKRLAKKLSKEIDFDESVKIQAGTVSKTGNDSAKPKTGPKAAAKPAPSAPAAPVAKKINTRSKSSTKPAEKKSNPS